jgi:hypothetical protein
MGEILGLLVTALVLGLRHGIDWDHIAAIGSWRCSPTLDGPASWASSSGSPPWGWSCSPARWCSS